MYVPIYVYLRVRVFLPLTHGLLKHRSQMRFISNDDESR